jgi:predicted anti-sigma-YlaC factor YlaD
MMRCEEVRDRLPLLLYGELTFDCEEQVEGHLAACAECQVEWARLRRVAELADGAEWRVDSRVLAESRARLFAALPPRSRDWRGLFRFRWASWVPAACLVAAGFVAAQIPFLQITRNVPSWMNAQLASPAVASVRFIEASPGGPVRLVVDEVYQRTVSGEVNDEAIRDLLIQALGQSADAGVRAQSAALLGEEASDVEVRTAMIRAATNDAHAAVRMRAAAALRPMLREDAVVREALIGMLFRDPDPAVRAQVAGSLSAASEVSVAGALQRVLTLERDESVRGQCVRTLVSMRASTDVY